MRQVVDTLVWLAMIMVIAAVVYFTPRLANYVTAMTTEHGQDCVTCHGAVNLTHDTSLRSP
jgi:hypothetical protein